MLRPESRTRARALQLLYAWEVQGEPPISEVAGRVHRLCRGGGASYLEQAERLAGVVVNHQAALDQLAADASENWRLSRLGIVERNILRLAISELTDESVMADPSKSAKVVIDEAVNLARWFGPAKSPGFVNGVLDNIAHGLGRL